LFNNGDEADEITKGVAVDPNLREPLTLDIDVFAFFWGYVFTK